MKGLRLYLDIFICHHTFVAVMLLECLWEWFTVKSGEIMYQVCSLMAFSVGVISG